MTGIGTQLALAELTLRRWRQDGIEDVADVDLPFFRLGAIAGNLTEFLSSRPHDQAGHGASPVFAVWLPVLELLADGHDDDGAVQPGIVANFAQLKSLVERIRSAVAAKAKFTLLDMLPEIEGMDATVRTLRTQLASVDAVRSRVATAVFRVRPKRKEDPVTDWNLRDVAHGHSTGRFFRELSRRAIDSGDPRLRAFGLGLVVAYSGMLSGNAFLNGVVGGPYRNHWWRHHWVRNHVDTWTWGYQATREDERAQGREIAFQGQQSTPLPGLPFWHNIAGGNIQDLFSIGGVDGRQILTSVTDTAPFPAYLPPELAQLWVQVHAEVIDDPAASGLDEESVQSAYAMAWLTTWLSSSSAVLGGTAPDRINEPDACGDRPAWAQPDGSVFFGGTLLPVPAPSTPSVSASKAASAIAAALLGLLAFATGNIGAGVALIAGAVALIDDATDPDWDELRCHLGWVTVYLNELENSLRDLLVVSGLAHPFTSSLRHNPATLAVAGVAEPFGAALNTCRTREDRSYPRSRWAPAGSLSNWLAYPSEPAELPSTLSYPAGPWWPNHFLDGLHYARVVAPDGSVSFPETQRNPLGIAPSGRPAVLDEDLWQNRRAVIGDTDSPEIVFGNAVDVATILLQKGETDWLDWDLDSDRGLIWPTWMHVPGGGPSAVVPQP